MQYNSSNLSISSDICGKFKRKLEALIRKLKKINYSTNIIFVFSFISVFCSRCNYYEQLSDKTVWPVLLCIPFHTTIQTFIVFHTQNIILNGRCQKKVRWEQRWDNSREEKFMRGLKFLIVKRSEMASYIPAITVSTNMGIQAYPQRMRLKRRLFGICLVPCLTFRCHSRPKLA